MTNPDVMLNASKALTSILHDAAERGLPLPHSANVSDYASAYHPVSAHTGIADGGLILSVGGLDDLTAWALFLDSIIGEPVDAGETFHYRAHGTRFGVAVTVVCLVPSAIPAVSA